MSDKICPFRYVISSIHSMLDDSRCDTKCMAWNKENDTCVLLSGFQKKEKHDSKK